VCRPKQERKDPIEGYIPREAGKKRNPSRESVIVKCVGLTSWLMESFGPFL
jgi:hypothetical protein